MPTSALLVVTTVGSAAEARALVKSLVEDRLIACGTLLPGAFSVYRWEGALMDESEVLVLLKTDVSKWPTLAAAVKARHPYQVPELLALPVERGLDVYLTWLKGEVVA